jgi:hypothetical protein
MRIFVGRSRWQPMESYRARASGCGHGVQGEEDRAVGGAQAATVVQASGHSAIAFLCVWSAMQIERCAVLRDAARKRSDGATKSHSAFTNAAARTCGRWLHGKWVYCMIESRTVFLSEGHVLWEVRDASEKYVVPTKRGRDKEHEHMRGEPCPPPTRIPRVDCFFGRCPHLAW